MATSTGDEYDQKLTRKRKMAAAPAEITATETSPRPSKKARLIAPQSRGEGASLAAFDNAISTDWLHLVGEARIAPGQLILTLDRAALAAGWLSTRLRSLRSRCS